MKGSLSVNSIKFQREPFLTISGHLRLGLTFCPGGSTKVRDVSDCCDMVPSEFIRCVRLGGGKSLCSHSFLEMVTRIQWHMSTETSPNCLGGRSIMYAL